MSRAIDEHAPHVEFAACGHIVMAGTKLNAQLAACVNIGHGKQWMNRHVVVCQDCLEKALQGVIKGD